MESLRAAGHPWSELRGYTLRQLHFWAEQLTARLKREAEAIEAAQER